MRRLLLPSLALVLVACGSSGSSRQVIPQEAGSDGGSPGSGGSGGRGGNGGSGGVPSSGGKAGAGSGGVSTGGASTGGASPQDAGSDASADAGPNPLDRWIDPVNGLDTNDGTSSAKPLKNLYLAIEATKSGGTLWLMDGIYDSTTGQDRPPVGPTLLEIADGVSLRAVHPGSVSITPSPLTFLGSGNLSDVHFEGTGVKVFASSGTVNLSALTFKTSGGGCSTNDRAAIDVEGTANVTLSPDGVTDYAGTGTGVQNFAYVGDDAHLTIMGGTFTNLSRSVCSPSGVFTLAGNGKLTMSNVTLKNTAPQNRGGIITMRSATSEVSLTDTMIDGLDTTFLGIGAAVYIDGGTGSPKVTLTRTTIQNLPEAAAILVGYENPSPTPDITISDSFFKNNGGGILANGTYAGVPKLTITNSEFTGNTIAGLFLVAGGTLNMTGGKIQGNAAGGVNGGVAGLALQGTGPYTVKLRNVSVTGNTPAGAKPGVQLQGSAASVFDFGKVGDPGSNMFSGNGQTGVLVQAAAGVTAYAVGNTWNANVQGASGTGTYTVVGAGAKTDVTTGTGTNYIVQTGTLRLAENP